MTNPKKKASEVTPEQRLADLIRGLGAGIKLSVAESCTGGLVASRITDIAGSSKYFEGGVVAYSNDLKRSLLGVKAATLKAHGAVSEEVAAEMAAGVAKKTKAHIALSLTGMASPADDTEKPVGTVYIGITIRTTVKKSGERKESSFVRLFNFKGSRKSIKRQSATAALTTLADFLEGL
ncbi:MAG: nicotinamide-nucleotide amidohydrolase family protein [Proteobacteria bacterium]|nr:nicotinamide-nucleotide amidohydrolase family protein [Pseudomonadota bacterium]